jgi:hypothetical protein
MIHGMLEGRATEECAAHLVVLYPADSERIVPSRYTSAFLHAQIAARAEGYLAAEGYGEPEARFFSAWEEVVQGIGYWLHEPREGDSATVEGHE